MSELDYVKAIDDSNSIRKEKRSVINLAENVPLDSTTERLSLSALRVLAARYLVRDEKGNIIETPEQMFERIAILITIPDILHDSRLYDPAGEQIIHPGIDSIYDYPTEIGEYELNLYHKDAFLRLYDELNKKGHMRFALNHINSYHQRIINDYQFHVNGYYDLMASLDFLPNTPTLMNAGNSLGQLSACFVLDMEDDLGDIMQTSKDAAMIFKSGGGVGINYSKIRAEGSMVASTQGVASGPLSFMKVIDAVTEVVKQGGKRRGANMAILNWDHPDINKFINCKTTPGQYENFNISVGTDEGFWKPENGKMLDTIAQCAWKSAEPGLIFFDTINRFNPLSEKKGRIAATNPCGEQSLYPYESCNLGSINLANFVINKQFDWKRFAGVVQQCVQFLDNVIDMNKYPLDQIERASKASRRIGLGIMGIADCLFQLGIAYNSKEGYEMMSHIAHLLFLTSYNKSLQLAGERGIYPLSEQVEGEADVRNAYRTTIAPTGTLSMIADCTNGVEPVFALAFEKRVTVGSFYYINKHFEQALKDAGVYSQELIKKVVDNYGSCKGIDEIPKEIQTVFVTAMDIHWKDHVMAQSVWQQWIDNAIAKTINMPNDATVDDVKCAYVMAHQLGCKGITVYRDGSRHEQVLHIHSETKDKKFQVEPSTFMKHMNCPTCGNMLTFAEGCAYCRNCGTSMCSSG